MRLQSARDTDSGFLLLGEVEASGCPICGDGLGAASDRTCGDCGARWHADCHGLVSRCPTFACRGLDRKALVLALGEGTLDLVRGEWSDEDVVAMLLWPLAGVLVHPLATTLCYWLVYLLLFALVAGLREVGR